MVTAGENLSDRLGAGKLDDEKVGESFAAVVLVVVKSSDWPEGVLAVAEEVVCRGISLHLK